MADCPDPGNLEALLDGTIPGESAGDLRAHLTGCARCQRLLEGMTAFDDLRQLRGAAPGVPLDVTVEERVARLLADIGTWPENGAGDDRARRAAASRGVLGPPERPADLGTLGNYHIEAELGVGGMGIVYRAYDPALRRLVALKLLRPERLDDRSRQRLVREAQLAARLRHDHLVTVYAVVDQPDGLPYLVMEYLAGPSLAELIQAARALEARQAALIVCQVADALDAAHRAGLVHRDVKPANIVLDTTTGRAKLMDFGLARAVDEKSDLTREGILAGTPTFMSPEQIKGSAALDARSDIYSLGATFYEALTGEPPFAGTPHMILRQVLLDEPRPLRRLNDAVPRDLETICLKALAKEPALRYPTAGALADDLRRWTNGEPIHARPAGPAERLWRWSRRNPRVAALGATVALLLVALATGSTVAALRIAREQVRTRRQRSAAIEQRNRADRNAQAARAHFTLALDTLNTLIFNVQKQLGERSATQDLERRILETARAGLEQVANSPEANPDTSLSLVVARMRLGDVLLALGRTDEAMRAFDGARARAAELMSADPKAIEPRRALANVLDRLGDVAQRAGEAARAGQTYRDAIALRKAVLKDRPDDGGLARELATTHANLGYVHMRGAFDAASARVEFESARRLLEPLLDRGSQSDRIASRRALRHVYGRLGEADVALCDGAAARRRCESSVALASELAAAEPDNPVQRRELAAALDRLGNAELRLADYSPAAEHYNESQAIRAALAAANPDSAEARRDLAVGHQRLGDLERCRLDYSAARDHYERALEIIERLARNDPGSIQKRTDSALCCGWLSENAERAGDYAEAARWADRALAVFRDLAREQRPSPPSLSLWKSQIEANLRAYQAAARGLSQADVARAPAGLRLGLIQFRALRLAREGKHVEAAALAESFRLLAPNDVLNQVQIARVYGLCVAALKRERGTPSTDDSALRDQYVRAAFAALRRCAELYPAVYVGSPLEPDLHPLFDQPGFAELVKDVIQPAAAGRQKKGPA
jgi:tRNA A-37 threonylcarbamoyl transferase component Bud32/tetratricopeptide (TPR) repeat protein